MWFLIQAATIRVEVVRVESWRQNEHGVSFPSPRPSFPCMHDVSTRLPLLPPLVRAAAPSSYTALHVEPHEARLLKLTFGWRDDLLAQQKQQLQAAADANNVAAGAGSSGGSGGGEDKAVAAGMLGRRGALKGAGVADKGASTAAAAATATAAANAEELASLKQQVLPVYVCFS